MKKSLLITLEYPPQKGGIATYLSQIIQHLPSNEIQVVAPPAKNNFEFDSLQRYKIFRKKLLYTHFSFKWIKGILTILPIIKREKIKHIITSHILPIGYIALLIKQLLNIPYTVILHGLDIKLALSLTMKRKITLKILKNAHSIIVNSDYTKNQIPKEIDHKKVHVINPCPNDYPDVPKSKRIGNVLENFSNNKVILSVGRLVERKGFDMVIKAMPDILQDFPDLIYVIIGDGEHRKELEALIQKNNISNHIFIYDNITDEELPYLYKNSSFFIMPNREISDVDVEGFGIVFLEANQYGKAVIGGNSGGVPEAIKDGETGILVDPSDLDSIKNAIKKLLDNPQLADQLGGVGKKRVERDFNWKNKAHTLKTLLEDPHPPGGAVEIDKT